MPVGFVYADAAADAEVWIVTSGIAYALPESGVTAARGNVVFVSNAEAGRVEQSATVPTTEHWREVRALARHGQRGRGVDATVRTFQLMRSGDKRHYIT